MRDELRCLVDSRIPISAICVRVGPTRVLLRDVQEAHTGKCFCDHVWVASSVDWAALGLRPGDIVSFDAKVAIYQKGYRGGNANGHPRSLDYGFTNIRNIRS